MDFKRMQKLAGVLKEEENFETLLQQYRDQKQELNAILAKAKENDTPQWRDSFNKMRMDLARKGEKTNTPEILTQLKYGPVAKEDIEKLLSFKDLDQKVVQIKKEKDFVQRDQEREDRLTAYQDNIKLLLKNPNEVMCHIYHSIGETHNYTTAEQEGTVSLNSILNNNDSGPFEYKVWASDKEGFVEELEKEVKEYVGWVLGIAHPIPGLKFMYNTTKRTLNKINEYDKKKEQLECSFFLKSDPNNILLTIEDYTSYS